jgi:hypothetical protein
VRLRTDRPLATLVIAAFATVAMPLAASPVQPVPLTANSDTPQPTEIARALEKVKADPNLATDRTIKSLRWRDSTAPKRSHLPAWLLWIAGLFRWLGESARLLVWCSVTVLTGLLVVFITRLVHGYAAAARGERFVAPTHVRDLDIRPESLPDDVGRAARALWDRGEHRASLALLYRGLLSRLAHVHRVPIRDSSTEGDCLALAATRLAPAKREYTVQLVRVWQRAVYGREDVPGIAVHVLCDGFAAAMDAVEPLDAVGEPA